MALVTALRRAGRATVAVELDGSRWRVLPTEAVVRAGLQVGGELDRPRARILARERRRLAALDVAVASLRRRDRSELELRRRLEHRRVAPAERERALGTLRSAGVVDDGRYAVSRAEGLARRGWGDAAIRHELARNGIDGELAAAAIEALEPERVGLSLGVGEQLLASLLRLAEPRLAGDRQRDCGHGAAGEDRHHHRHDREHARSFPGRARFAATSRRGCSHPARPARPHLGIGGRSGSRPGPSRCSELRVVRVEVVEVRVHRFGKALSAGHFVG
jgi:hypothetical protein